jgi:pimeloyl-ACP methyl ester carboxylesterase
VTDGKPTVVYLPGLDGTGRLLFAQERLQRECHLICQRYPNNREHSYQSLADDAARVVEQQGDGGPVVILAESFGGGVAIEFVTRYPQLVNRLILVNTFAKYPTGWLVQAGGFLGLFLPDRPTPRHTRKVRERFLFADDLPREIRNQWWQCVSDVSMAALGHRVGLISGLDRRDDLERITTKTLVVVAKDDRTVPPKAGYLLADKIPDATLYECTGGHTVMSHPTFDLCSVIEETAFL